MIDAEKLISQDCIGEDGSHLILHVQEYGWQKHEKIVISENNI